MKDRHEYGDGAAEDLLMACVECGTEFLWTAGEQRFFYERAYAPPRRCRRCIAARKGGGKRWGFNADASAACLRT